MIGDGAVITVLGDVARDINLRIDGRIPEDLVVAGDTPARIQMVTGGSAATTAAWIACTGVPVALIAARGDDDAGQAVERDLRRWGVLPELQTIPGASTGTVVVIVDGSGERTMLPDAGANVGLESAWCRDHLRGSHLHISAYPWFRSETRSCIDAVVAEARTRSMTLSVDLNSYGLVRTYSQELASLAESVDIVFANELEFAALTGGPFRPSETLGPIVVVKLGSRGSRWMHGTSEGQVDTSPTTAVDTGGAGDSFAAGFLAHWVTTGDIEGAAVAGNLLAGQCVTRVGSGPTLGD